MNKVRFLEEKKLIKTLEAEREKEASTKSEGTAHSKSAATNPIAGAFLRFVHTKHKFNIKDL